MQLFKLYSLHKKSISSTFLEHASSSYFELYYNKLANQKYFFSRVILRDCNPIAFQSVSIRPESLDLIFMFKSFVVFLKYFFRSKSSKKFKRFLDSIKIMFSRNLNPGEAWIVILYVEDQYRRDGLASYLFKDFENNFIFSKLYVDTLQENTNAILFYNRLGFTPVDSKLKESLILALQY